MPYTIVNSTGKKLSGFYPNCGDCSRFLVYRENDWYFFSSKKEAEEFLRHIRRHGVGRNLRILKGG